MSAPYTRRITSSKDEANMKIIIIGCGKVGLTLAELLSAASQLIFAHEMALPS